MSATVISVLCSDYGTQDPLLLSERCLETYISLLLDLAIVLFLSFQGYGDHKPKSSTAAQEVKTLDGIFSEQVSMGPMVS